MEAIFHTEKLHESNRTILTVILAWISNFLPFRLINLQVSSSTEAAVIWNTSCPLGKRDSNVLISCFKLLRQAMTENTNQAKRCHAQREKRKMCMALNMLQKLIMMQSVHDEMCKMADA